MLVERPMDLEQKTLKRHKDKKKCWQKAQWLRIKDHHKTQKQTRMLVENPMDLGQKTPKNQKDK